jgi:hypothetical protein
MVIQWPYFDMYFTTTFHSSEIPQFKYLFVYFAQENVTGNGTMALEIFLSHQ